MKSLFSYKSASYLVMISSLIYIFMLLFAAPGNMILLVVGIVFLALSWGLRKHKRWMAYVAFLTLLFAISFAISGAFGNHGFTAMLYGAIALLNIGAFIVLFGLLWRPKSAAA